MSVKEFLRVPSVSCFSEIVEAYEAVFKGADEVYLTSINRMEQTNLKARIERT